jgi:natural product precursor
MKKMNKLKLNILSKANLRKREMDILRGKEPYTGRWCSCSCYYEGNGGSSSNDNSSANYNLGSTGGESTNGCNQYYTLPGGSSYCSSCTA